MGVYLVHRPLHNFSPEVGGGRLHGNGRLQGTFTVLFVLKWESLLVCIAACTDACILAHTDVLFLILMNVLSFD